MWLMDWIYGYDNIEPQTKNQPLRIVEIDGEKKTENTIKTKEYIFKNVWLNNQKDI